MYHIQERLAQKALIREIFPWLGNLLQLEQTTWIVKIQGKLFTPVWGDCIFTWPQEDQEEDLQLRRYCRQIEADGKSGGNSIVAKRGGGRKLLAAGILSTPAATIAASTGYYL